MDEYEELMKLIGEEINEEYCPNCGKVLHISKETDYYGLMELDKKCCGCGYHYNWSYGLEVINNWLKG